MPKRGWRRRLSGNPVDVLVADADPPAPLTDSLSATDTADVVHLLSDAEQVLDLLHQRGNYADTTRPDFVLLDFHLPEIGGEAVLAELVDHDDWQRIPVVVLTDPDEPADVERSYELHANAAVKRPTVAEEWAGLAEAIENFWLDVARLPP